MEVNKTHITKCSVHNQTQNLSQDWKDTCESSSCERLVEIKTTVSCNVTSCKLKWAIVPRLVFCCRFTNGGRDRAVAAGGMVRGSNPCDGEIFRAVQTCPEDHAASCQMCTGPFLGAKVATAWC
jgi:hypothetical protein